MCKMPLRSTTPAERLTTFCTPRTGNDARSSCDVTRTVLVVFRWISGRSAMIRTSLAWTAMLDMWMSCVVVMLDKTCTFAIVTGAYPI